MLRLHLTHGSHGNDLYRFSCCQGVIYEREFGGTKPADFDAFYELILVDELSRVGGGNVLGQVDSCVP